MFMVPLVMKEEEVARSGPAAKQTLLVTYHILLGKLAVNAMANWV